MSFNLIRNARMFFTTNVDPTTGVVASANFSDLNTKEIQVLDGFSFSQATGSETVTLNEAGDSPIRGQRSFNTSLEPVEFTFSTYVRPDFVDSGASDYVQAEEDVLWNALAAGFVNHTNELIAGMDPGGSASPTASTGTNAAWTQTTGAGSPAAYSTVAFTNSNKNQMTKFGVIIILDGQSYIIDNCALDQATIDFGLDAIATIAWTGRGAILRGATISESTVTAGTFAGGAISGTFKVKNTTAPFIANKLSTITVARGINSTGGVPAGAQAAAGKAYTLALTGGSLTIANNITYLTPANLGIVNKPVTYFTGTRAISGTVNCYLRVGGGGTNRSADLINDMLADAALDVDPGYNVTVKVGGASGPRIELAMPAAVFTIPTINTEQVVSTAINFTAQAKNSGNTDFDIANTNELNVTYHSNV